MHAGNLIYSLGFYTVASLDIKWQVFGNISALVKMLFLVFLVLATINWVVLYDFCPSMGTVFSHEQIPYVKLVANLCMVGKIMGCT